MSAFHHDMFNRRSSSAFLNEFRQDNRSGVFAAPAMPKPMFCSSDGQQAMRRSSFSGGQTTSHKHFAYVAGCEICEEYVRRGTEICHHEHRVVCRGVHRGCCCHHCCHERETSCTSSASTAVHNEGYRARTEESTSDSAFGNGRVRARSATTMVGDASFGFANMDSEMLRMAADNKWRSSRNTEDAFYGRPFSNNECVPHGHVQLREENVGQVFDAHRQMHGGQQSRMHAEAQAHFSGYNRPQPLFTNAYGCRDQEEETKVKVTTTTTTTTTTRKFEDECVPCPPPRQPTPPLVCHAPPPVCHRPPTPPPVHHVDHHHHHVTVIPVGTKPDVLVKRAEPCCTWCKFLPCLSCPKPTNPNERFKKQNFRLFPEYEFLPDHLDVPKPTEYFPAHTHFASRSEYTVTIPKVMESAQRIYVDFVGDQMIVMGEHGKPVRHGVPRHMRSSPSVRSTRSSSISSRETAHMRHMVPSDHHPRLQQGHHVAVEKLPLGVSRVFAKNFFLPRDTYDRNRAQAFIKPNGKLKIVVPVLEN
ncbi:hypothetical protein GGF40_001881 [Coemansia sp. RSA 1286]|nr:hypothetical protein GGF40_001881 [Coemansia sp. RSA 1286]